MQPESTSPQACELFWRFCHGGCRAVIASALISHLFFLSEKRAVSVEERRCACAAASSAVCLKQPVLECICTARQGPWCLDDRAKRYGLCRDKAGQARKLCHGMDSYMTGNRTALVKRRG